MVSYIGLSQCGGRFKTQNNTTRNEIIDKVSDPSLQENEWIQSLTKCTEAAAAGGKLASSAEAGIECGKGRIEVSVKHLRAMRVGESQCDSSCARWRGNGTAACQDVEVI